MFTLKRQSKDTKAFHYDTKGFGAAMPLGLAEQTSSSTEFYCVLLTEQLLGCTVLRMSLLHVCIEKGAPLAIVSLPLDEITREKPVQGQIFYLRFNKAITCNQPILTEISKQWQRVQRCTTS